MLYHRGLYVIMATRHRHITTIVGLALTISVVFYLTMQVQFKKGQKPVIQAFIMSKCPDAQSCVEDIIYPALEKVNFKADLHFEVIASIEKDGSIVCKHGDDECIGNEWILAVQKLYGVKQTAIFTKTVLDSYGQIPSEDLFHQACTKAQVPYSRVQDEVRVHGRVLLVESALKTKQSQVVYSCTIHINGREWCVVDGGKQKGCEGGYEKLAELIS